MEIVWPYSTSLCLSVGDQYLDSRKQKPGLIAIKGSERLWIEIP